MRRNLQPLNQVPTVYFFFHFLTFPQHVLDFVDFDFPRRVGVVEVECEHAERRVGASAKIPEREHELFEVDLAAIVSVEYRKRLCARNRENARAREIN